MKRKWWILGGVALTAAISLCFFGVRLRIAPRLILSRCLSSVITQLDNRFEKSPVHLLSAALDPQGKQQANLKLETEAKHLGTVVYDMTMMTQTAPNRVLAEGSVITGGKVLDLSLFLNENFAAVSSRSLVEGHFYGITYDTFSRDIRDRQLLAALIGEETITGWEASVTSLQAKMQTELEIPEIHPEDIRTALFGVLALKPEISRQEIALSDGSYQAYVVSFRALGTEIAAAAEPYRSELSTALMDWIDSMQKDPESAVTAAFFLHKGKLVRITVGLQSAEQSAEILLHLGESPVEKTIALEFKIQAGEDLNRYSLQIMTETDGETYQEKLYFVHTGNGRKKSAILDYQWDLSSGDMILEIHRDAKTTEQRLNLTGEGRSVTIRSQNIRPLLNLLMKQERVSPAICNLTVSPGREVEVPEYRNLDQWSADDLFSLLGGLGGLLGLKLP